MEYVQKIKGIFDINNTLMNRIYIFKYRICHMKHLFLFCTKSIDKIMYSVVSLTRKTSLKRWHREKHEY